MKLVVAVPVQVTSAFLPNPTVDYSFHKIQVLDSILKQLSEVHIVINYFLKINFNIILPLC